MPAALALNAVGYYTLGMETPNKLIEQVIIKWAEMKRAELGDSFATAKELESIKSDPIGSMELLRGYDAFDVMRTVLEWN